MTLKVKISGVKKLDASGNIGNEKRIKPSPPSFRRMPARMTEPAVGASTWASGSQVWTGHIGTLTAKEAKKASHSHFCSPAGKAWVRATVISVVPVSKYTAITPSSINIEPRNV